MSLLKNRTVYRATFRNLKLLVFGSIQVIRLDYTVRVHQVSCRPEKWTATPIVTRDINKWQGRTAEQVMQLVAADFEECVQPWQVASAGVTEGASLRPASNVTVCRMPRPAGRTL